MVNMKLNQNLRNLRELNNYSQLYIARFLQIGRTTYANYEQGRREPDYLTLLRIADFYKVSVDFLLGRTEQGGVKVIEKEPPFPSLAHKDVYAKLLSMNSRDLNLLKQYVNVLCEKTNNEKKS